MKELRPAVRGWDSNPDEPDVPKEQRVASLPRALLVEVAEPACYWWLRRRVWGRALSGMLYPGDSIRGCDLRRRGFS